MKITNYKTVYHFTKEDVTVLKRLYNDVCREMPMGPDVFSTLLIDIIKDPEDRTFDFAEFENFGIEVER